MSLTERDEAVQKAMLELVPEDGSAVSSRKIQAKLQSILDGFKPEEYLRARDALIESGVLRKAPGRGGSVRRTAAGSPAAAQKPVARPSSAKASKTARKAGEATAYQHTDEAVQRPDIGVEAEFPRGKPPSAYRYDSSLAPELSWDENADRALAEWLINLVAEAADKGEATFAETKIWKGGGGRSEEFDSLSQCAARLRSITKPYLNWTGKAERSQLDVPTLPLFVHERHSTKAILDTLAAHKSCRPNPDLFGATDLDIADKLDAYEFTGPWANRLILGDSLQVMNSLLEYEGMGGQVQMIYFDPPYGVKFGSNFQPFVRKREVKDGKDDHMSREPEMVKAFRDTWQLGLHSYLTHLRDRLMLAREMLTESGSIFLQISDENVHHAREVLNEVFGEENYLNTIIFKKKSATPVTHPVNDFILWSAKDKSKFVPRQLYYKRPDPEDFGKYRTLVSREGKKKTISKMDSKEMQELVGKGWRWAQTSYPITSQHHSEKRSQPYRFEGEERFCGRNRQWSFEVPDGLDRLAKEGRLYAIKGRFLGGIVFWDDWPYVNFNNIWTDVHGAANPIYVVQTNDKVIERCLLMATDPGDLVLDITCGSGTTPVVAERWGRRWIACDTSRVPIALAKQRLLTSIFPWCRLKDSDKGPAGGFVYVRKQNKKGEEVGGLVPRITLKSIANDEEPEVVTLVHLPEVDRRITRVCGPFTVEATVRAAKSIKEEEVGSKPAVDPRAYLDRMIEVLRQSKTLQMQGNAALALDTVRPLAGLDHLHAECVAKNGSDRRIAIAFGDEDAAIGSEFIYSAHTEALQQGFEQLFLFGFAIQAKAHEMLGKLKVPTSYVSVTPDVNMSDLLKTSGSSQIFSVTGLPDVRLERAGTKQGSTEQYQVVVRGLDIFRPDTMETEAVAAENLPCWMLDTDYNGMAFYASQVFFPKSSAWKSLRKSLRGNYEESVWDHLEGTVSAPFELSDRRRIAVKVIDDRGNELMAVRTEEEAL